MRRVAAFVFGVAAFALVSAAGARDPLPSWQDGDAKAAILRFVAAVSDPTAPSYLPRAERIAVLDTDGTLRVDQPGVGGPLRAADRAACHADANTARAGTPGVEAAATGVGSGVAASCRGDRTERLFGEVAACPADARDLAASRPFAGSVSAPMLELLDHLRAHGFSVYVASGGGAAFVGAFAEAVHEIPLQSAAGSLGKAPCRMVANVAQAAQDFGIAFLDDRSGEAVAPRPILAIGRPDSAMTILPSPPAGAGPKLSSGVDQPAHSRPGFSAPPDPGSDGASAANWIVIDVAAALDAFFEEDRVR